MTVIALDFDGVVADSENECYVVSLPAFRKMGEEVKDSPRIREEFRKARPFVKEADCYYTVLKMVEDPKTDFDKIKFEEFDIEREKSSEKGKEFHEFFYEERARLQNDMDAWVKLNPPFGGVPETVNRLKNDFKFVIVTTKDMKAARLLLKNYGIDIDEENILSKEISMNKRDRLSIISDRFNIRYEDIVFVEDNLEQILGVKDLGVKLVLVSWGYNNEKQRKEAKQNGIVIANKENFEQTVRSLA